MSVIATVEQLEAIYGIPGESSTVKVADRVTPSYRVLIEKSPFAALATPSGSRGARLFRRAAICRDFVRIHDETTLMMPDSLAATTASIRFATSCVIPGSHCCS